MDEAIKINSGAVSSLADTDLVLAADAQGKFQPISVANLMGKCLSSIQMGVRNLVRKNIYSNNIEGAYLTNGMRLTPNNQNTTRVLFTNYENVVPGLYAYSFWAKSENGQSSMDVDISDSSIVSLSVGADWKFYSGVVNAYHYGKYYGFIDFKGSSDIIISDLTVVQGNIPLQQWSPAPEDLSGGGNARKFNRLRFEERRVA